MDKITSIERLPNGQVKVFILGEQPKTVEAPFFLLSDRAFPGWRKLDGELPLKYYQEFRSSRQLWDTKKLAPKNTNYLHIYDDRDSALVGSGENFFKGISSHKELSTLSFDIESTSLTHGPEAKTLLISNTYRDGRGAITRKLFAFDEYHNDGAFFTAWSDWVRQVDPDVVVGHNIISYDIPYLIYCAKRAGVELKLGRDNNAIKVNTWESSFRKDQSQFYPYFEPRIFGRNIIDTFFLAIKADTGRKYESYGLKQIIKQEKLEVEGRQFYDASLIRTNYTDKTEWEKIKQYAIHDADDSLAVYDLHIPSYFGLTKLIPKCFSNIVNTASGSQINQMIIQQYIQRNHSIPLASPEEEYEGALSGSNPGIYTDCFKVDVASLYPSLMLSFKIEDKEKDPLGLILKNLDTLRTERLKNKQLGKTSEAHKSLSESQKIILNSTYGFLGTKGLNFNSPKCAARITEEGRRVLSNTMEFCISKKLNISNFDTDGITISDNQPWPAQRRTAFVNELNEMSPDGITWEDDGLYKSMLIVKTKNYAMRDESGKVKIKGSALKAPMKEIAVREMLQKMVLSLLDGDVGAIPEIYKQYVVEAVNMHIDINRWSFKKTLTENTIQSTRQNETKIIDALQGEEKTQQGDKYFFYFRQDDTLRLSKNWTPSDHNVDRLLGKLYDTVFTLAPVYPIEFLQDYTLKRNKKDLVLLLETTRSTVLDKE
jgi:DNA polymerase I